MPSLEERPWELSQEEMPSLEERHWEPSQEEMPSLEERHWELSQEEMLSLEERHWQLLQQHQIVQWVSMVGHRRRIALGQSTHCRLSHILYQVLPPWSREDWALVVETTVRACTVIQALADNLRGALIYVEYRRYQPIK